MRHTLLGLGMALSLSASCHEFARPEHNVCGNQVVELGEDCDTHPVGVCRPPGTPGQCRFDCSSLANGAIRECPSGMVCGVDSLCRRPSGRLSEPHLAWSGSVSFLQAAEIDGDGFFDLLGIEENQLGIHYGDALRPFFYRIDIDSSANSFAFGQIGPDDSKDIFVGNEYGISVTLGSRPPIPIAYPVLSYSKAVDRLIALDAMPSIQFASTANESGSGQGHEILGIAGNELHLVSAFGRRLRALDFREDMILGNVAVGNLIEDEKLSPCEEMAIAVSGQAEIRVLTPCLWDGSSFIWNDDTVAEPRRIASVALPFGELATSGVFLSDINADGHLDMLVRGNSALHAAFGVGDGTFHSDASTLPPTMGNALMAPIPTVEQELDKLLHGHSLIAVGHLNGDTAIDLVLSSGVVLSAGQHYRLVLGSPAGGWRNAVVGDFDRNGHPDLLLSRNGRSGIDYLRASQDVSYNWHVVNTKQQVEQLLVGDYDGDFIADIAYTQATASKTSLELSAAFGTSFGGFGEGTPLGVLERSAQIVSGDFSLGRRDGATDIASGISRLDTNRTELSLFLGRWNRTIRSPVTLIDWQSDTHLRPLQLTSGRFDADAYEDLAVLAQDENNNTAYRLVLLPSTVRGSLSLDAMRFISLDSMLLDWSTARLVGMDVDRDGLQEILIIGNHHGRGVVMVVGLSEQGKGFLELKATYDKVELLDLPGQDVPGWTGSAVVQLDPNKREALVLRAKSATGKASIVLLPVLDGRLDLEHRQVFSSDTVQEIRAFGFIDLNGDTTKELLILSEAGLTAVDTSGKEPTWREPLARITQGRCLAIGDVDRDGLQDVIVGGEGGIEVRYAIAELP